MMLRRSYDTAVEVWIVFADVLVGFLAIVLMVTAQPPASSPPIRPTPVPIRASPTPTPEGRHLIQPPAVEHLTHALEHLQTERGSRSYEVSAEGFEVHVIFEEKLLFEKCEWVLDPRGQDLLKEVAAIIWQYDPVIERIQIEGHADKRPAENCSSLGGLQNIGLPRDNLLLSSLRAMAVQQELAQITESNDSANLSAATPETSSEERLAKLEAVGRGSLHPRTSDPRDPKNRRIEITVHFQETRKM
jgi:outer membrane protein OmpA-like peptidoglycan-associated protein